MTSDKPKQKKRKEILDQNPIEVIGQGLKQVVVNDLGKESVNALWDQLLGSSESKKAGKKTGDLSEGQELDIASLNQNQKKENPPVNLEPGIDYRGEILHAEQRIIRENSQETEVKIQEIIIELKKLTASSKELEVQFKDVTVTQVPVNAGKYHVNFFEWVLATIRQARMRVEDSANWLSMFTSKKNKKQYWNMFKKHGTTFGLSNERVVATQTG